MNKNSLKQHSVEDLIIYDFILHLRICDHTTVHDFGSVVGRPLDTFFWALTNSWLRSWLVCEMALYIMISIDLIE